MRIDGRKNDELRNIKFTHNFTKHALGSILVVSAYLIQVIIFGQMGWLGLENAYLPEFYVVSACFTIMALWRHRANVVRLLNGTENKIGVKKN